MKFYLIINFNCNLHLISIDMLEFESTMHFYSQHCKFRKRKIYHKEGEISVYCEIENFAGDWQQVGIISTYCDSFDNAENLIKSVSV